MRISLATGRLNLAAAILAVFAGCSRGPTAIEVPPIQPEAAAEGAISLYDKNGDGKLAADEVAACPALVDALKNNIDKDRDRQISKEELVERFTMWAEGGIGLSYLTCRVSLNGRPLQGAIVKFVPESFFSGMIQSAEGKTGRSGAATLAIDKSHLPADLQNFRGVQQGLYRVEITHPTVNIADKYNTNTTLGLEVSFDTGRNIVSINL